MPKQLNVNLGFTADTSQAKKQIQELRQSLQDIAKLPGKASSLFDDTDIKNASKAALELQQHLNAAVNVNTGKLDLSRLSTSLKAANKDLNEYYGQLTKIGPQGQEAFLKLAKSISTAEAPVTRINAKLAEMGTSLKNTARWQLSSSIIHGFMGTIQGAYGYAQDLNESLNNIRIVTGQSVDEMAKFAEKANASAKALSTTTTAYTDAALIFYQQGLSGKEVTDRTDTVIKMANVTRQSAEEVSSYMTAIWNNFYDGSASLEHYADVITALGAATASSSAEISEGLSKFASVADTIGLSYDYATSILAALVANTRQSADVIGTSLKTILARLQSVKLGETLEDGVELTKYTSALDAIGVSVLDLNGNLRDADDILDDTAAKWDTLNKAQQASVAQTVAGTRQYSQFIAMMANWDDVEKNLQTAQGSEGALQNQADIYAESWEAAQKRVKAAAQGIYQDLLDDKFFIGLTNGLEKVLEAIHGIINGFGGMKGILTALGSIFLTTYAQKMPEALNNLRQNFMVLTGQATKLMTETQQKTQEYLNTIKNDDSGAYSLTFKTQAEGMAKVNEMQQRLILNSKNMTEQERQSYQLKIQNVQMMYEEANAIAKEVEELEKKAEAERQAAMAAMTAGVNKGIDNYNKAENKVSYLGGKIDEAEKAGDSAAVEKYTAALREAEIEAAKYEAELDSLRNSMGMLSSVVITEAEGQEQMRKALNDTTKKFEEYYAKYKQVQSLSATGIGKAKQWQDEAKAIQGDTKKLDSLKASMKEYIMLVAKQSKESGLGLNKNGEITELYKELKTLTNDSDLDVFAQKLEKTFSFNTAMDTFEKEIDDIREKIRTIGGENALTAFDNAVDAAKEKSQQLKDALSNTGQAASEMPKGVFNASTAWTQFASSAMATYTALNSLKNTFSTFTDALEGNASALDVVGAGISALMSIMMAYNAVAQLTNTLKKSESIMNLATAFTENTVVGAKIADIAATLGLEAAMTPLLIITLAVIAAMAALAIAIVAVVAIFKAVQAASPEGKLKALKEEATECSKAFDEAKTAAEELKSAFDNYDSLVEKLNECTQGTQEWKDALIDVNNAVLDLMANYPELAQYVTRNKETGQLEISQAGMDSMRDSADAAVINAQAATVKANANVKNQEIGMQAESIAKDNYDLPGWLQDKLYNDPQSLSSYDDIRQMIADNYDPTYEKKSLDKNSVEFQQWLDEQMIELKNIDGMDELIAAIQANTLAQETGNQAIADNILANDEKVQNSKYAEEVMSASGDVYGQLYDDAIQKLKDDGWGTDGISKATKVNDEAKRVFSEYAEAAGLTGVTLTDTTGTDGNRKFVYEDAEGNETTVSLDAMRKIKAAADAQEQLGEAAQNLIQTFTQLDQSGQAYDQAIMDMLSNKNFEDSTQSEIKALKDLAETDKDGMAGVLGNKFGDKDGALTDAEAQALGYKSAEVMIAAFTQGISDYDIAVENVGKNWLQSVQSSFDNLDLSDLTLAQQKALGEAMEQAAVNSGSTEVFDNLLENIPTDELDEFSNVLGTVDWQNDTVDDLKKKLEEAGISTVGFDDKLQALIDTMDTDGIQSAEALGEKFKTMTDITNGLEQGDSISADDYKALGSEVQGYFTMMMDGTYKLTGSAKELQETVQKIGIADYQDNISKIEEQNANLNRLKGYDSNTLLTDQNYQNNAGENKYNETNVEQQLDALETLGYDMEQIAKWREDLADGNNVTNVITAISDAINDYSGNLENLDETIAQNEDAIKGQQIAIAMSFTDIDKLRQAYEDGTVTAEAFNTAVMQLNEQADLEGLDTDELEDYSEYLQEICDESDDLDNALKDNDEAAQDVAKSIMKMNRGIDTLADNYKDWADIMKKSTKESKEFADASDGMRDALSDVLDVSGDFISTDFITGHLDDIEKAAMGDADAIDRLKNVLADDIIANIIVDNELESQADQIYSDVATLKAWLDDNELKVGTSIDINNLEGDEAAFVDACNRIIADANMTAEQANAYFDAMGFETSFVTKEQPMQQRVPEYVTETVEDGSTTVETVDSEGKPRTLTYKRTRTHTYQDGYFEAEGKMDAMAMAVGTDGKTPVPQIQSITKKAGGAQNNYSSKNSGGKGPGKSKSGGKSKGGGGKAPEHKHKEKVDKFEADPFHKVNQELEDIEHNLKMIDKQQSHMFGRELINNLKQQNAQLKKQTELHKEKLAIAQRETDALRAQLKAQGVAFDGDNIANYNAMLQAAENQINALINQYNALSAAEQEAYDNAYKETKSPIQKAEDYYEKLKKQMDKYTDYMSTVYSEEEAIQDALFQQIENNLKAYQVKIEVKLDMSEARRAMNKFLKDMSTDIKNMYKTSAEWATAFKTSEKDAGTYEDDINTKLKQLEDYKNASVGGENDIFATESEKYKAITDLEKEILEDSDNLLNEYQTAYDNLRDAFGEVADQFNEILDQFDSINDTLDHYAKVIELLYGGETDNGRKQLAEVYSLQKENSLERQDAMRKWGDELQKRRAEAIANGYDEDDSYIKDIDAQIEENSKNLESEIENYIDTIQRELENSIKMAQSQMDKSIWGASMADVRQEWDDKKAMADGYYDSVERIYQLESLESKWKAAITNTSSLKAQQQLAAIMDKQVASLESKNALSEKDIELAEKELAVYQAQIALEEAQNNKNSMKLTRDETGNWSYQYVADEDDIADKQQSYLDKVNEWRTASISAAEEITEKTMDAYEAFSERMTEIMNDVTLSEEERDAKIAELNATYWGEDGIITKLVEDSNYIQSTANQSTYVELAGLYEADQANLERMSEAEKTIIENMTAAGVVSYKSLRDYVIGDDGKSGMYGEIYDLCKQTNENSSAAWKSMAASAINRMYKDPNSVSKTVKQAYIDMEGALKIYNKAVENSEKASGIEWSKVGSQLDGVQKKIKETGKRVDEFTSKLKALGVFEKAVLRIKETWDKTSGSIKKATSDLEKYYKLLSNGKSNSTSSGGGGSSNTGGGSTSQGSGGDGKLTVGETVTYTGGTYYYDSYGTSPAGKRGPGKKVKVTSIKEDGRPYPIHVMSTDSAYGWLTKGQLSGYDTGGYTGDWAGGDGRLALLHSKELVLNKDDTKNILDTVQILRQFAIKDLAQSVGDAISYGLNSLIGKALNFNSNNYDTTQVNNNTNEEQNVTINVEAVFPHADDINEIREAILSLPNYASQFKMRK